MARIRVRRGRRRALILFAAICLLAGGATALSLSDDSPRASTRAAVDPPRATERDPGPDERGAASPNAATPAERAVDGWPIHWRQSRSIGEAFAGRLVDGVKLPSSGGAFETWDPIHKQSPNRWWRRWGNDGLIRATLEIARAYRKQHAGAPRLLVGDLSRPRGGDFGPQYGSIGHASHQNGLDIDVYYPRHDRKGKPAKHPAQVDQRLAQSLVDLWVAAGAERVFVGPSLNLSGPPGVVQKLVHHDDHLHARLPAG